ncbi:hypothetical protein V6N13_017962 [Hibiscus sabdariffa]|uniref:CBS domain-containing protein n=1 Tax=Hibiscus sabdariffa TaxID=183260 RepID=A0ABR1Z987_9ROSI
MQDLRRADLRQLEDVLKEAEETTRADYVGNSPEHDHATALQLFLDRIPINNSIPGIRNAPVVELKTGDSVKDAIELLYTKNAFGAPITDVSDRFPYIGFLDFATLVLWSLEKCVPIDGHGETGSLMSLLGKNPEIGNTKIGELAKSFLWNPFFAVHLEDTLFHVLLLLSKHRVQVAPIVDQSHLRVIGFVTQTAVIQLLLRSDGLAWFDSIVEKPLAEFRFENESVSCVYGDESIAEALRILFKSRIGAIAVVDRQNRRLIGCVRNSDVYLLMENDKIFHDRKTRTVEEFIHIETENLDHVPTIERDMGALLSAGVLELRNKYLPRMDSPVTNKKTDTLKQAMKNLAGTKSDFSFQVDDLQRPQGILTSRDIILQFAPPSMNSNIDGGGFFESALERAGCQIKGGNLVCDH